jgi:hypothetical protein
MQLGWVDRRIGLGSCPVSFIDSGPSWIGRALDPDPELADADVDAGTPHERGCPHDVGSAAVATCASARISARKGTDRRRRPRPEPRYSVVGLGWYFGPIDARAPGRIWRFRSPRATQRRGVRSSGRGPRQRTTGSSGALQRRRLRDRMRSGTIVCGRADSGRAVSTNPARSAVERCLSALLPGAPWIRQGDATPLRMRNRRSRIPIGSGSGSFAAVAVGVVSVAGCAAAAVTVIGAVRLRERRSGRGPGLRSCARRPRSPSGS